MKETLQTTVDQDRPHHPALSPMQQDAMAILRQAGKVFYPEVVLRLSITMGAALALWNYTGLAILPVLLGLHTVLNLAYLVWLLKLNAPFDLRTFHLAMFFSMALTGLFSIAPVYLIWLNDPVLTITALAGIGGMALHNLITHGHVRGIAIFASIHVPALLAVVAAISIMRTDSMWGQILLLFCFFSVSAYYVFCHYTIYRNYIRTRIAEARAKEAQRMQAIGQMTRGSARDFNGFLTGIQGNLEPSQHLPDGAEREQTLERAREAARLAADVTSRLVAYARQTPLRPEHHDLKNLMSKIATRLRGDLPDGRKLVLAPVACMTPIEVDSERLTRALQALAAHTNEAAPAGGTITLRARLVGFSAPVTHLSCGTLGPGTYCMISILDDGPGIAPDLLDRVTEPFFTTSGPRRNSGLGLPMALGFADRSDGALGIASQPGRTEVTLCLPCPDCTEARLA